MQNVPTPRVAILVHVSLVLSEMESSALMSMNVITIHATQRQSAKTQVAAINAIVNKVIKAMVILVQMLMNVVVIIVVIEMPDVKTLLDHTYVNVLLDILVMVIHALISTNVQPRATRVVKTKIVLIPLAHIIASVKSDLLLKMKNVPTSTNVEIKLVIPMQFALIPLVVSHVSVKMGSEVMA